VCFNFSVDTLWKNHSLYRMSVDFGFPSDRLKIRISKESRWDFPSVSFVSLALHRKSGPSQCGLPGCVFCHSTFADRVAVLNQPGVESIVRFNRKPAMIPDEQIALVRRLLESGLPLEDCGPS